MNSNKFVFFSKRPQLNELCHVVLQTSSDNIEGCQLQILKSRQLLILSNETLTNPRKDDRNLIDCIVSVAFYKSSMSSLCSRLQLKPLNASVAKNFALERCLRYTLQFRICQSCSFVGDLFIFDVNFLNRKDKVDAISVEINVSDQEIMFELKPCVVRSLIPDLENFGVSTDIIEKFNSNKNFIIPETAININWCHILPSMKRGQIVSIFRDLSKSVSSLKDYEGISKYWRTHYAYNLPPNEDMIYCNIYFIRIPNMLFTYPLCCIRTKPFQYFPRYDSTNIIENFFSLVRRKFTKICGFQINFTTNAAIFNNNLSSSLEIKGNQLMNTTLIKLPDKLKDQKVPNKDVILSTQPTTSQVAKQDQKVPNSILSLQKNSQNKFVPIFGKKSTPAAKQKTQKLEKIKKTSSSKRTKSQCFDQLFQSASKTQKRHQNASINHNKKICLFDKLFSTASSGQNENS